MGMHFCAYCHEDGNNRFQRVGNDDILLVFTNGSWLVPGMILHYIEDHEFQPSPEFIEAVMNHQLVDGRRIATRSAVWPPNDAIRIGYLEGDFQRGPVPEELVDRLITMMVSQGWDRNFHEHSLNDQPTQRQD
jgi:hypothetical protein